MKKLLFIIGAVSLTLFFSSCLKNKSYTCECTYVPDFTKPAGTPEKHEKFTVQGRLREQASDNCQIDNENKYAGQGYDGNCRLVD